MVSGKGDKDNPSLSQGHKNTDATRSMTEDPDAGTPKPPLGNAVPNESETAYVGTKTYETLMDEARHKVSADQPIVGSIIENKFKVLREIGVGGMGNSHVEWFSGLADVAVAALSDVDRKRLGGAHLTGAQEGCPAAFVEPDGGNSRATDLAFDQVGQALLRARGARLRDVTGNGSPQGACGFFLQPLQGQRRVRCRRIVERHEREKHQPSKKE